MTPEERNRIEELERTVRALSDSVKARKGQQLAYPLDPASRKIVDDGNLVRVVEKVTASAPYTNDGYITVDVNGRRYRLMTTA